MLAYASRTGTRSNLRMLAHHGWRPVVSAGGEFEQQSVGGRRVPAAHDAPAGIMSRDPTRRVSLLLYTSDIWGRNSNPLRGRIERCSNIVLRS